MAQRTSWHCMCEHSHPFIHTTRTERCQSGVSVEWHAHWQTQTQSVHFGGVRMCALLQSSAVLTVTAVWVSLRWSVSLLLPLLIKVRRDIHAHASLERKRMQHTRAAHVSSGVDITTVHITIELHPHSLSHRGVVITSLLA